MTAPNGNRRPITPEGCPAFDDGCSCDECRPALADLERRTDDLEAAFVDKHGDELRELFGGVPAKGYEPPYCDDCKRPAARCVCRFSLARGYEASAYIDKCREPKVKEKVPSISYTSTRRPTSPTLPPGPCAACEPAFWSGVVLAAVVAAVIAVLVSVAI